ncbi:MAG TPA: hypothetical protein VL371_20800 [Gemmataceae bacterium]|jgi:hypothetical protein|nr:hypothetical protein [Gemmataceae bacterium]
MNLCRGQLASLICLATFAWPMTAAPFAETVWAALFAGSASTPGIPDEEDNAKEPTKLETSVAAVQARPSAEQTRRPVVTSPHPSGRHSRSARPSAVAPAPFRDSRTPPLHC